MYQWLLKLLLCGLFDCSSVQQTQPGVLLVNDGPSRSSESGSNVVVTDRNDLDLVENLKMLHLLKMSELQFTVPKKGQPLSSVIHYFRGIEGLTITETPDHLLVQEANTDTQDGYVFKMKLFFEKGLYTSAVVNHGDGTW